MHKVSPELSDFPALELCQHSSRSLLVDSSPKHSFYNVVGAFQASCQVKKSLQGAYTGVSWGRAAVDIRASVIHILKFLMFLHITHNLLSAVKTFTAKHATFFSTKTSKPKLFLVPPQCETCDRTSAHLAWC